METPELLWSPSEQFIKNSNLYAYQQWLKENKKLAFHNYQQLWEWSTENISEFWKSIWEYFNVLHDGKFTEVLSSDEMPFCKWFEGTRLNYAEHVFRNYSSLQPAIIFKSEDGDHIEISWKELQDKVSSLQKYFIQSGVKAGDRIAAYIPCTPEATIAFLAANALGAVWSSCSPDFGVTSVIDRFAQIEPRLLIATDHYRYGGKQFDKSDVVRELIAALPTVEKVILLPKESVSLEHSKIILWESIIKQKGDALHFERVPFNHPIWILYSSGTTGLPKAITHSQGGILLEQFKYASFHNDFKKGERCFWYTTTGWMMWNYIHSSLLIGGIMVLYDGSPAYPDMQTLWQFNQDARIEHFGTSAGFILANAKAGVKPSEHFNLSSLRSISSTGSTLPPEGFEWIYSAVKKDLWLASMSGGTDICSAFVGGNPTLPVYAGEIQSRALGCTLEAFDEDGNAVKDEVGEMVITKPMPSMPIYFWNDVNFKRYRESYFEMFPHIWRHGDWIKITSHEGIIIYGRSDATLNRGGVRIGTSEIYRAVDKITEVKDSLIICIEKEGGEFWMPLFVLLNNGQLLTAELKKKINSTIRSEYSPRHVPDEIIAVPDIPYTISGKKTETPVKKILMGKNPGEVLNTGTLRNPESMDFFLAYYKNHHNS